MSATPIGAATDTAGFIRAQIANGVSVETLRRRLKIRPEHMLDLLAGARAAPSLPKPVLATKPHPTGPATVTAVRVRGGDYKALRARGKVDRAEAEALISAILPVVGELADLPWLRIRQPGGGKSVGAARAMVYGLAIELRPHLTLSAIASALNKTPGAVHAWAGRCGSLRKLDRDFERKYLRALSRLAP